MDDTKPSPDPRDYHEGPEAAERFSRAVKQIFSVPREEMKKREEAWKKAWKKRNKKVQ